MDIQDLGTPSIKIAGLAIWVHGFAYPDATEAFDRDWLRVTAHCGAAGAAIQISGEILIVRDIQRWGDECKKLHRSMKGQAVLESYEPYLKATLDSVDTAGHLILRVEITPHHLTQGHWFEFETDQSFLPDLISQCNAVVTKYS